MEVFFLTGNIYRRGRPLWGEKRKLEGVRFSPGKDLL
jgi:hypothetical protein